jgi:hypothetical protein
MQTSENVHCGDCGYNLQGLPVGNPCPECGSQRRGQQKHTSDMRDKPEGFAMRIINSNLAVKGLAPVPDVRIRVKYWLKLGGICVSVFFVLQLLVTIAVIPIGTYRLLLFAMALVWPTIVMGMMPSKIDASMPPMYRIIRTVAPYTQWCWAAGYALWLLAHVTKDDFTLGGNLKYFPPILLLHTVAGIGLAGIVFWLHDFALRLDLHTAAKRCNVFATGILTWGVLVFVLPWKHFAAANVGAVGMLFFAYVFFLMVPWLWMVSLFARALFEFSADASWSLRYDKDIVGRQDRIRENREEYEQSRWF